jgi:hypothetical protein
VRSRVFIVFWASTAATVLLLGSVWTLAGRIGSPGAGPQDYVLVVIAGLGLLATGFVSARIVFVIGPPEEANAHGTVGQDRSRQAIAHTVFTPGALDTQLRSPTWAHVRVPLVADGH